MFFAFHRHLLAYDRSKYCQCMACKRAVALTLKVVTHYGEFTGYNVKNFNKLIGKGVIVAHQLLKNNINQHEYWLVTKSLSPGDPPGNLAQWMKWCQESKQTETGEIPFHYALLSPLKNDIPPEPSPQLQMHNYVKMISVTREYETDIITLFHASGDFNYRHRWQEGIQKVEEVDHLLPRVGMRCRCIKDNGETTIYSSSYHYHPDRIEFSETDDREKTRTFYTLEKITPVQTRLTLNFYMKKNILAQWLFQLNRKRNMEDMYKRAIRNLDELVKEINLPAQNLS